MTQRHTRLCAVSSMSSRTPLRALGRSRRCLGRVRRRLCSGARGPRAEPGAGGPRRRPPLEAGSPTRSAISLGCRLGAVDGDLGDRRFLESLHADSASRCTSGCSYTTPPTRRSASSCLRPPDDLLRVAAVNIRAPVTLVRASPAGDDRSRPGRRHPDDVSGREPGVSVHRHLRGQQGLQPGAGRGPVVRTQGRGR